MSDQANPETGKAPWTIKAVDIATREKAVRYAKQASETMGEWIARAVETQANQQDGVRVIAPTPPVARSEMELVHRQRALAEAPDLMGLAALIQHATAMAAAAEVEIPKVAARHAMKLMTAQLRAARGLPPLAPRQTKPRNRQTIAHRDTNPSPEIAADQPRRPSEISGL